MLRVQAECVILRAPEASSRRQAPELVELTRHEQSYLIAGPPHRLALGVEHPDTYPAESHASLWVNERIEDYLLAMGQG